MKPRGVFDEQDSSIQLTRIRECNSGVQAILEVIDSERTAMQQLQLPRGGFYATGKKSDLLHSAATHSAEARRQA
jgi:hypothetical protein